MVRQSAPKKKVKTGCRTCKTRRVKCDEGRPACHRCVSTGRTCDGYGVWGGGGNALTHRSAAATTALKASSLPCDLFRSFSEMTVQEEQCFKWFRYRTFIKLPLPVITPFWHTLVFQASAIEPAILHAVIALSAAHRNETMKQDKGPEPYTGSAAEEKFMVQEYNKAIGFLQPHFSKQDKKSLQIALASCAIFTFLENLLGNFNAALAHLQSGLKLLATCHSSEIRPGEDDGNVKRRGYVDDWIIETFIRLFVQAALLGQIPVATYHIIPKYWTEILPASFDSSNQACHHLDKILIQIMLLGEQCSSPSLPPNCGVEPIFPTGTDERQVYLQKELDTWQASYKATSTGDWSRLGAFYFKILATYHTMASILVNTLTWPACETIYDFHTTKWLTLITQLIGTYNDNRADGRQWHHELMREVPDKVSATTGDKGWIPVLYFVGIKCRIHRIRRQAIMLLNAVPHKEGMWDSDLISAVIAEVMRIEEGDYYLGLDKGDDFLPSDIPTAEDLTLPSLPENNRLIDVKVGLPDNPEGVLTMEYGLRDEVDFQTKRFMMFYDLSTQVWYDTRAFSGV
ncbi:hypothetical protein F5Y18DRAFT_369134 [Xylariaceae sp. FL1019]|nr:hypothetical protein F5Y18DRAFT_369134 [Xylariaceae sp. FL1019]